MVHEPMSVILPNKLFLSGVPTSGSSLVDLDYHSITHIVNLTFENPPSTDNTRQVLHIETKDEFGERLEPYFETVADFVQSAWEGNGKVLIHCHQGISRSATLIISTLMILGFQDTTGQVHHDLTTIVPFVRSRRFVAEPRKDFANELREFEYKRNGGQTAVWTSITMGDVNEFVPFERLSPLAQINEKFILLSSLAAVNYTPVFKTRLPDLEEDINSLVLAYLTNPNDPDARMKLVRLVLHTTFEHHTRLDSRDNRARQILRDTLFASLHQAGVTLEQRRGLVENYFEEDEMTFAESSDQIELLWSLRDGSKASDEAIQKEFRI